MRPTVHEKRRVSPPEVYQVVRLAFELTAGDPPRLVFGRAWIYGAADYAEAIQVLRQRVEALLPAEAKEGVILCRRIECEWLEMLWLDEGHVMEEGEDRTTLILSAAVGRRREPVTRLGPGLMLAAAGQELPEWAREFVFDFPMLTVLLLGLAMMALCLGALQVGEWIAVPGDEHGPDGGEGGAV
jgi:hypothetical protein